MAVDQKVIDNNEKKDESTKDKKEEHIEETLSKLNIDLSNYDDFADINEKDQSTATLKIIIFIVFVILILGGLYILNNLFDFRNIALENIKEVDLPEIKTRDINPLVYGKRLNIT